MNRWLALALVLTAGTALAGPLPAGEEPDRKREAPPVKVYTNADLERLFGSPSGERGEAVEYDRQLFGEEALAALLDGDESNLPARRARAEEAYHTALARVGYLERKIASIQNPFLPRPVPTEEDAREEKAMDNVARLSRTLKQMERAKASLQEAEAVVRTLGGRVSPVPESEEAAPAAEPRIRTVGGGGD